MAPTDEGERERAAARLLLVSLWEQARADGIALPPDIPPLLRDGNGKPHLEGRPAELSLSHDSGCALAVLSVSRDGTPRAVGADLVSLSRPLARRDELARRFFTDGERAALDGSPEAHLRRWAAKEAAVKLTGEGAGAIRATDTSRDPIAPLGESPIAEAAGRICLSGDVDIGGAPFHIAIYL